jgi:hypothetical protein
MMKMVLPKKAGVPAFWLDSGYVLNSLRTISLICGNNQFKSREQLTLAYPELLWSILENFSLEEIGVIRGFFLNENESIVALKKEKEIKTFLEQKFSYEVGSSSDGLLSYKRAFDILKEVYKAYTLRDADLLDFCKPKDNQSFRPAFKTTVENALRSVDRLILTWSIPIEEAIRFKKGYKAKLDKIAVEGYVYIVEAHFLLNQFIVDKKIPGLFEFTVEKKYLEDKLDLKTFLREGWEMISRSCKKISLGDIVQ